MDPVVGMFVVFAIAVLYATGGYMAGRRRGRSRGYAEGIEEGFKIGLEWKGKQDGKVRDSIPLPDQQ